MNRKLSKKDKLRRSVERLALARERLYWWNDQGYNSDGETAEQHEQRLEKLVQRCHYVVGERITRL